MKQEITSAALALFLLTGTASANSILPTLEETFGKSIPDVQKILAVEADSTEKTEDDMILTFNGFTDEMYEKLGIGLKANGCYKRGTASVENGVATQELEYDGEILYAVYDRENAQLVFTYPAVSRLMDELTEVDGEETVFDEPCHLFGTSIPTFKDVVKKEGAEQTEDDGTMSVVYHDVTDKLYDSFNEYLGGFECEMVDSSLDDGVLTATLRRGNVDFTIIYDHEAQELIESCNDEDLYYYGTDGYQTALKSAVLPSSDELYGVALPNLRIPIGKEPSEVSDSEIGHTEIYTGFSKDSYSKVSTYLQEMDCEVSDYSIDGEVITINLTKNGAGFVMVYDPTDETATLTYETGTRIEPTPTPSPTPGPTAEPTPKPSKQYSKSECKSIATQYFKNLSWKNPDSLTIHSISDMITTDGYMFTFDYSAQNGFGGYTRDKYYICVSKTSGQVTSASK